MAEQNPKGMNDDPRQADESGEPGRAGRSHGRVIDKDNPEGTSRPDAGKALEDGKNDPGTGTQHWESGRQRSN